MKTLILTISSIGIMFIFGCGQAQNISSEKEAEKMLKDFYTKYFTVFATAAPGASSQNKLEMLQKQYCTETFFKKIPEYIEQTGSDPFLKAQDSDVRYLKTLSISKDLQKGNYIVSYIADGASDEKITITIHVTAVKEGNSYKIDSVE